MNQAADNLEIMSRPDTASTIDQLYLAIENNELVLPTMPDWAIKIQNLLDDINASANQIVSAISGDPALVAQLIKTANSATYCDKPKVDTVMAAVSRLGYKALRNLILMVTMARFSNAEQPAIKKYLSKFWEHSREVAAISYVLAKTQKHLNPEQAMLAGLIHEIGTLPLCLHAEKMTSSLDDSTLNAIVSKFHSKIGEKLLQVWEFPLELVEVVVTHEDLQRETGEARASYADVVTVANMLNRSTVKITPWENIAAVKRLWLSPEFCRTFFEQFDNELRAANDMLS